MKYSLIAAVVLLALAQGSFAQDAADLERLSQYFEDLKTKLAQEVTELMRNQDLANQAQTFFADSKTQLEPLASRVQEQVKSAAATVEDQIKPLATSVQAQVQPMVEEFKKQMESFIQRMTDQAHAIAQ